MLDRNCKRSRFRIINMYSLGLVMVFESSKKIAVAVVEYHGSYVVGQRPAGVPLAGYSEFPGGKVEPNETFERAAVRECFEETGLRVVATGTLLTTQHEYPHGKLDIRFIACNVDGPMNKSLDMPSLNHSFHWVARHELARHEFPEANARLINYLLCQTK